MELESLLPLLNIIMALLMIGISLGKHENPTGWICSVLGWLVALLYSYR